MGTRLDTIIINGLIRDKPIDNEIKLVLRIKRAYLHLFNFMYLCLISI